LGDLSSLAIAAVDFTKLSPKIPESPLSLMLVKIIPLALPLLQAPSSHPTTNFSNKIKSSKQALRDGVVFHLKPSWDFGIEEKKFSPSKQNSNSNQTKDT
jgi:hypothetical protein